MSYGEAIARELAEAIDQERPIFALLNGRLIGITNSAARSGSAKWTTDGRIELTAEIYFWNPGHDEMYALSSGRINAPEQEGWSHGIGLRMRFEPSAIVLLETVNLT
ncbi:MAG: hypothetical protein CMJ31_02775 [Phycisphaerae bacterium]|nr:hypothetical protein [Phycisphaerae bacterium]|tara:strand:+ start:310 stop:630 length:321 start_codon:yes stop_codon:yes gene_type:complete